MYANFANTGQVRERGGQAGRDELGDEDLGGLYAGAAGVGASTPAAAGPHGETPAAGGCPPRESRGVLSFFFEALGLRRINVL